MEFDFDEYYSRHFPLKSIGRANQLRLKNKTALVAGVGGLGTKTAGLLVSLGVGRVVLVDYDIVEQSNLARQDLYTFENIGEAKVDAAARRLRERNPSVEVIPYTHNIDGLSVRELLKDVDVVLDGLDRFSVRRTLHSACYDMKIPFVFAGAVAENANVMTITFNKDTPCLICALGYIEDSEENTCAVLGVHPSILNIAASIQVTEAVKILLGQDPALEGRMLLVNLDMLDFDRVKFSRREDCPECERVLKGGNKGREGEVRRYRQEIAGHGEVSITSLCGRDTVIITPDFPFPEDTDEVLRLLQDHWRVSRKGESVLSYYVRGIHCSLMKSGVMTIRGAGSKDNAFEIYRKMVEVVLTNTSEN